MRGGLEDWRVLIDFNFGFEALIQYVNNVVDFTNSNREFWGTYCHEFAVCFLNCFSVSTNCVITVTANILLYAVRYCWVQTMKLGRF